MKGRQKSPLPRCLFFFSMGVHRRTRTCVHNPCPSHTSGPPLYKRERGKSVPVKRIMHIICRTTLLKNSQQEKYRTAQPAASQAGCIEVTSTLVCKLTIDGIVAGTAVLPALPIPPRRRLAIFCMSPMHGLLNASPHFSSDTPHPTAFLLSLTYFPEGTCICNHVSYVYVRLSMCAGGVLSGSLPILIFSETTHVYLFGLFDAKRRLHTFRWHLHA